MEKTIFTTGNTLCTWISKSQWKESCNPNWGSWWFGTYFGREHGCTFAHVRFLGFGLSVVWP